MTTHRALYAAFGTPRALVIKRAECWTLTRDGETKHVPNHPAYRIALLEDLEAGCSCGMTMRVLRD